MNKLKNKKSIIIISIILLFAFLLLFLLVNIKKLNANAYVETLGFKDENLYNCVLLSSFEYMMEDEENIMDFYDSIYDKYENFPAFNYYKALLGDGIDNETFMEIIKETNFNISKDDLNSITSLSCDFEVKDYQGIEMLESLEWLEIEGDFEKLDLSQNTKLKDLRINNDNDKDKNVAKEIILAQNLDRIYISGYDIENVDFLNSKSVNYLDIQDSDIGKLSFEGKTNVSTFSLQDSSIGELVFENDNTVNDFNIGNSNINKFDISKLSKIKTFYASGDFDKIDLSNSESITNINIVSNTKNIILPKKSQNLNLFLKNDFITFLDLSGHQVFGNLSLELPILNNLNFDPGTTIASFNIRASNLETLDISNLNVNNVYFTAGLSSSQKSKINNMKVGNYFPSTLPNEINKIYTSSGEYIEFNKENVMLFEGVLVFKDDQITINDILNKNHIIDKNGFELKICGYNTCNYNSEYSDMNTKLNTIPGSYLNIYKNDSLIYSYTIDVFDNDYIKDYKLYKSILNSNSQYGKYAANNLTEEQLRQTTELNLNYESNDYSELKKLIGLKNLSINYAKNIPEDLFENFLSLESLRIYSSDVIKLNISNLPMLNSLNLQSSNIENLIIKNNPKLKSIYATYNNIKNVDLFNNDTNNIVESLSFSDSKLTNLDVSSLHNLETLNISDNNLETIGLSNNLQLKNLNVSDNILNNLDLSLNINLEELNIEGNRIKNINLKNNEKLRYVRMNDNELEEIDLSNNSNIEDLRFIDNKKLKSLKGIRNMPIEEAEIWNFPNLETIDLTGAENIYALILFSNKLKKIDISDCKNLSMLLLISGSLEEINGIDKAENLSSIAVPYSNIKQIDFSQNKNLQAVNLQFSPVTKNNLNLLVGDKTELKYDLILPENFKKEIYNSDDYIADYDEENNLVLANNVGHTVMSSYFPSFHFYLDNISKASAKATINVYDIKSSKFLINKEERYIFNENNESNKVLNRYIKVYGENVSKKIEGNKLYMYSGDEKIFVFDILEMESNDYKIDNNKNTILYSGTFDISKLKVVNGSLNKVDDTIQLICNDNIVRTYKLEKK